MKKQAVTHRDHRLSVRAILYRITIGLCIIALLIVIQYANIPPKMRYAYEYNQQSFSKSYPMPWVYTDSGILYSEDIWPDGSSEGSTLVLLKWDGSIGYSLHLDRIQNAKHGQRRLGVSDDGLLVSELVEDHRPVLHTWYNGSLCRSISIPNTYSGSTVSIVNNKHEMITVYSNKTHTFTISYFNGIRYVEKQVQSNMLPDSHLVGSAISDNAKSIAYTFRYKNVWTIVCCDVSISGVSIKVTPKYSIQKTENNSLFHAGSVHVTNSGVVFFNNGEVYDAHGKSTENSSWDTISVDTVSSAVLQKYTGGKFIKNRFRIWLLESNEYILFDYSGDALFASASKDYNHVFVIGIHNYDWLYAHASISSLLYKYVIYPEALVYTKLGRPIAHLQYMFSRENPDVTYDRLGHGIGISGDYIYLFTPREDCMMVVDQNLDRILLFKYK